MDIDKWNLTTTETPKTFGHILNQTDKWKESSTSP